MITIEYDASTATAYNMPADVSQHVSQELTYTDLSKEYQAKRQKGRWEVNPHICLLNAAKKSLQAGLTYSFPTGLIYRVAKLLSLLGTEYEIEKKIDSINVEKVKVPDWAYEHQRKIVETALHWKRCMIESPTGSGKTYAAAFFLDHFPTKSCLFVVPSKSLLYQTQEVLEEFLDEPVGLYGDGKKKWERVTVGIINSLKIAADKDHEDLKNVEVMVLDEAHHIAASMYKVLSQYCTNTDYRLALSATLERRNNDLLEVEAVSGPLALKIESDELSSKGLILKPDYIVVPFSHKTEAVYSKCLYDDGGFPIRDVYGNAEYDTDDGKPLVVDVQQEGIGKNDERNALIVDILKWFIDSEKRTGSALVLVEYINQAMRIQDIAKEKYGIELPFCSGSKTGKQVDKLVEQLSTGEIPALISTKVLNEGKDTKPVELAILAGGGAGGNKVIQQVGRVVRTCEKTGKKRSIVVDFTDENAPYYLSKQAIKRQSHINREHRNCVRHLSLKELKSLL